MFGLLNNVVKAVAISGIVARDVLSEDLAALYRAADQRLKWVQHDQYGEPYFDFYLSPEYLQVAELSDAFGYIDNMHIGTDVGQGDIIGGILKSKPGRVFSIPNEVINPNCRGLSITANTGILSAWEPEKLQTAGVRIVPITVSDLGVITVKITIVDGTQSYMFYDYENGSDSNDGKTPKRAKKSLQTQTNTVAVNNVLLKRGSIFLDSTMVYFNKESGGTASGIWFDKKYGAYGNPLLERPIIRAPQGATYVIEPVKKLNGSYQTYGGITWSDIILDANYTALRCINAPGGKDFKVLRCKVMNTKPDGLSNGLRFDLARNLIVKHCESENLYGEALYTTDARGRISLFNLWGAPLGHTDDCEQNSDGQGRDFITEHNIMRRKATPGASKGSIVHEYCQRQSIRGNRMDGIYFSNGIDGSLGVAQCNFMPKTRRPEGSEQAVCYAMGIADTQDCYKWAIVGNLMADTFNGSIMKSMGYKRYDILFNNNTYYKMIEAGINYSSGASGEASRNSFIECPVGVKGLTTVQTLATIPTLYDDATPLNPEYSNHTRTGNVSQASTGFHFPVGLNVIVDSDPREGQTMNATVINAESGSTYEYWWVLNDRFVISTTSSCTVPLNTIANYVHTWMPKTRQGAQITLYTRITSPAGKIATPVGKWADRSFYKFVLPA